MKFIALFVGIIVISTGLFAQSKYWPERDSIRNGVQLRQPPSEVRKQEGAFNRESATSLAPYTLENSGKIEALEGTVAALLSKITELEDAHKADSELLALLADSTKADENQDSILLIMNNLSEVQSLSSDNNALLQADSSFGTTSYNYSRNILQNAIGPDGKVATVTYETVAYDADDTGPAGNAIELVFDGIDDITDVTGAWNTGNPDNTVTHDGVGTTVPTAGTITLVGGRFTNAELLNAYALYDL